MIYQQESLILKNNRKNYKMTPQIYNIFSTKKEKPTKKINIEVDYREQNSLVPRSLEKLGFAPTLKELKVGDYIVNEVVIERKTISDFLSSMINKRLLRQLEELQQYEKKLLIIEGFDNKWLYNGFEDSINPNAIRGFILSISLKHKIPIIFTKNEEDTAKYMSVIANKKETNMSINAKKKTLNKQEQMQFILEGFPGIGPKTSKKLLKEFKSLQNIFNTSQEDLEKILGKKAETFKKIICENF